MRRRNLCRFAAAIMAAGFLAGITLGIHPLASVVLILGVVLITTNQSSFIEARAGPDPGDTLSYTDNIDGAYSPKSRTAAKRANRHLFIFTAPTGGPARLCHDFAAPSSTATANRSISAIQFHAYPSNGPHQSDRTYRFPGSIRASPVLVCQGST